MNPREEGFLLLTAKLGNPMRKTLTVAQLRNLAIRVRQASRENPEKEIDPADLMMLGYGVRDAERIMGLMGERELLHRYVARGEELGCHPITRVSEDYPACLRVRLGLDAPGCLWTKGNREIFHAPAVALVGSRELRSQNEVFAREVGKQAALQGYTLISGNARGADCAAQESCLAYGGRVISIVSDALQKYKNDPNVLYLSEEGYDLPFSTQRALSRNRVIHCMPTHGVFVAQCSLGKGGTWSGTVHNLQCNWCPVYCFRDGSDAVRELEQKNAMEIGIEDLQDFSLLHPVAPSLF